ncbi:MAG: PilW family protein [Candidatus Adiutrix sp.]|nr:PilW family protein [Candidatus Adiutrix sp.]
MAELLLVMLIALLVSGVGLSLYRLSYRYYAHKDALLEQNQNLRTAMATLVRDLRMAGNGLLLPEEGLAAFQIYLPTARGGWFRHSIKSDLYGVRPIFGLDGTLEGLGPDRLTIFWAAPEAREPVARLTAAFQPGSYGRDDDLLLERSWETAPAWEELIRPGDILALVHNGQGLILTAGRIKNGRLPLGELYRPRSPLPRPGFQSFPPGARLYNLRDFTLVTYYVDGARRRLMAEYHRGPGGRAARRQVVLAVGIEDMQLRYFLDGEKVSPELGHEQVSESELDGREGLRPRRIQAVNLTLVSRSSVRLSGRDDFRPLAVYNHRPGGGPDGRERRLMSETVILRANSTGPPPGPETL